MQTYFFTRPWVFCLFLLMSVASFFYQDLHLLQLLSLLPTYALNIAEIVTKAGEAKWYIGTFLALILLGFFWKKRDLAVQGFYLLFALLSAVAVCETLKVILGRARPIEFMTHHIFGFTFFKLQQHFWSFPSGHTTVIAAVAVSLFFISPLFSFLFGILTIAVGASRIILHAHYLSDVLMAIYIGGFFATWTYVNLFKTHKLNQLYTYISQRIK